MRSFIPTYSGANNLGQACKMLITLMSVTILIPQLIHMILAKDLSYKMTNNYCRSEKAVSIIHMAVHTWSLILAAVCSATIKLQSSQKLKKSGCHLSTACCKWIAEAKGMRFVQVDIKLRNHNLESWNGCMQSSANHNSEEDRRHPDQSNATRRIAL